MHVGQSITFGLILYKKTCSKHSDGQGLCSRAEIKGPHGRMTKNYSQNDQKIEREKIVSSSFGLLFDAGGTRLSGLKGLVMALPKICT